MPNKSLNVDAYGAYDRADWVRCTPVPGRPEHNQAFYVQYLWDHTELSESHEEGGFKGEELRDKVMQDTHQRLVDDLRSRIHDAIYARKAAILGGCLSVTFLDEGVQIERADHDETRFVAVDPEEPIREPIVQKIENTMMELASLESQLPEDEAPVSYGMLRVRLANILMKAFQRLPPSTIIDFVDEIVSPIPDDAREVIENVLERVKEMNDTLVVI